jgi:hypothetical protein
MKKIIFIVLCMQVAVYAGSETMNIQDQITTLRKENASIEKAIRTRTKKLKTDLKKSPQKKRDKKYISQRKAMIEENKKKIEQLEKNLATQTQMSIHQDLDNPVDTTNEAHENLDDSDNSLDDFDDAADDSQSISPTTGGGTVVYNPTTGQYKSLGCKNGLCPLAKMRNN